MQRVRVKQPGVLSHRGLFGRTGFTERDAALQPSYTGTEDYEDELTHTCNSSSNSSSIIAYIDLI